MEIDCLKGYIGLSEDVEVASGLYLNALPGISTNSVNGIANSEQVDSAGVMEVIEKRSLLKFRTFFTRELNRCFQISKRDVVDCIICENKTLLAVSLWYLMGAELMLEKTKSERINRFTTIDKKSYQELSDEFMGDFFTELSVAVAGINIDESGCIDNEEVECNNILKVVYTQP